MYLKFFYAIQILSFLGILKIKNGKSLEIMKLVYGKYLKSFYN